MARTPPPPHAHTTHPLQKCNHPFRAGCATLSCCATADRLVGRAPGLPASPQVTPTPRGRREKLTPLQRRAARSSIHPFPGHTAAALGARASGAPSFLQTPCCGDGSPVTGAAPQLSAASGAGRPSQSSRSNPGVSAAELRLPSTSSCPALSPLPGEHLPRGEGASRVAWSLPALQTVGTLSLPAPKAGWQLLSTAPSSCTTTACKAPGQRSSLPPAHSGSVTPGAPGPILWDTQLCPGLQGPWGHHPALFRGPSAAQQGGSPHFQLSPAPLRPPPAAGLWRAAQCRCRCHRIAWGQGPPPTLPAAALPFSPAPTRPAQRLVCGTQVGARGLPATRPAHRQQHPRTPNRAWDPKRGTHGGARLQASLPLCPHVAGGTSPCPAWGCGCSIPRGRTHLVPGSTATVGLRMPGVAQLPPPSSVAQGLCNPLLPVAGVTEAPSGHTWDSGTCLW